MRIIKKTTDSAVVGLVSAILLIGLIVTVISIIQLVYVPVIMEQREAEHMDKVTEQFGSLTSVIDSQAAIERTGIPIATFVTLGNKELPFLVSSKAFGTLEIVDNARTITITNNSDGTTHTYRFGVIAYSSDNAYFLDQTYTYEAGAMIVSQSQGNSMVCRPGFYVEYDETANIVNISFDLVNISSFGQKTIAGGFGTYPIHTEFIGISTDVIFINVSNITITTPYSNAWFVFVNRSLTAENLNYAGYGTQYLLTGTGNALQLDFPTSSLFPDLAPDVNIVFRIIDIRAQIGPGWAE
jgi:hypothetical protein